MNRSSLLQSRLLWPIAGLGLLLLYNLFFDRAFFEVTSREGNLYGPLLTVLRLAVKVMLLSTGMTLVIATGGVDLSVGSITAVVGALVASCATNQHIPFPALLGIALAVALAAGIFNGALISFAGLQPIIATLIMMVLGRGAALSITGGVPIKVEDVGVLFLGRGFVASIPAPILLVAAIFAITALACRKTAIGLFIEAVGDNEVASHFAGLNTRAIKFSVYIFSAICAALAALVAIGDVGRVEPDRLGQMLELDAITAVVVGGTALTGGRFTLTGSLIGAVLVQTLTVTLIRQGMPSDVAPVPKALVIIIVCLLQSPKLRAQISGLVPKRAAA
jgi:ribose/xylose/arabinose/galactoside ABC-type transport system permease subunit